MPHTAPATVPAWVWQAWTYYGLPAFRDRTRMGLYAAGTCPSKLRDGAIGEVRYAVGWHASQVARVRYSVRIDGESVDEEDSTEQSDQLIALVTGRDRRGWITRVTTNLLVGGFGWLISPDDDTTGWQVVSPVQHDRDELLRNTDDALVVPFMWQHPADDEQPDPPLFGVLDVLAEIRDLQILSRVQNRNRVAQRGILAISDDMASTTPTARNGDGGIHEAIQEIVDTEMTDDTLSAGLPVVSGPSETIRGGGWADWLNMDSPYDARIDARLTFAIQRLAWGLPNPPEVLLGHNNRALATAEIINGEAYRAHIEPTSERVATVIESVLSLLLTRDDGSVPEVDVLTDGSPLTRKQLTPEGIRWAREQGLISDGFVRESLGIPEDAAPAGPPVDRALETVLAMLAQSPSLAADPGIPALVEQVRAEIESVSAEAMAAAAQVIDSASRQAEAIAADVPDPGAESDPSVEPVAEALSELDARLLSELSGAVTLAVIRAREKVGARARTLHSRSTPATPEEAEQVAATDNADLPALLGTDRLDTLGVRTEETVRDALTSLADWWETTRLPDALKDLDALLEEVEPGEGLDPLTLPQLDAWRPAFSASAVALLDHVTEQTITGLDRPDPFAPDTPRLRTIIATAADIDTLLAVAAALRVSGDGMPPGFAISQAVVDVLASRGIARTGWRWIYGTAHRDDPHPTHRDLSGQFYTELPVGIFEPGDHKGCLCRAKPVFRDQRGRFTRGEA